MAEPDAFVRDTSGNLRAALMSLLEENLTGPDLRDRLPALVTTSQPATAQPMTNDVTDHPGYQ